MAASFQVAPSSLAAAASAHDAVAGELEGARALLRSSLGGAPWGDDEPGSQFGATHRRSEDRVVAALDRLDEVVRSVADGLRANAVTYAVAETATTVP